VPAGDGFTPQERHQIDKAIRDGETVCRLEFSVYVGPSEGDPRGFAERLHSALVAPARSVLVMVDPSARVLEVVTGEAARRDLDDQQVGLVVVEMQSQLTHGDLVGAITRGISRLAAYAHKPRTLHT
jgi:uncharacterized membrane protein YgcG